MAEPLGGGALVRDGAKATQPALLRDVADGLVRDPVDGEVDAAGLLLDVDLVIRRPAEPGAQRLGAEHQHQRRERDRGKPGDPLAVQRDEAGGGEQPPPERRGVEEGEGREGRDAGEAAEQVEPVRGQRLEVWKSRPTPSPRQVITAATATKISGRVSHAGAPVGFTTVK